MQLADRLLYVVETVTESYAQLKVELHRAVADGIQMEVTVKLSPLS